LNTKLNCQGCGVHLQTEDKEGIGYAPKSALKREEVLCKRCFRLKHYNEIQDVSLTDDDFLNMVSAIRDTNALVVHLIDIFDVEGTLIKSLPRIIGDNPIILVGNKVDLLPKSTNKRKLVQWLQSTAKDAGLHVKETFLISSKKGQGIDELTFQMENHRKNGDVYIVGTTNVGKSTFINRLIKQSTGENNVITTSYFPGTTLGFISIPLNNKSSLIDTPGIVNRQQMAHYVSEHDLKIITPDKEIKPRTYQLNSQQTLFLGGLARLDFIKGEKQPFVCYFSNHLKIHRTKLENADQLYKNQIGDLLFPPDLETLEILPPLTESTYRITEKKKDIIFPGLGWVSIPEGNVTVAVHTPKGLAASLRKSLL